VTITRSPLPSDSAGCSAWPRQTLTLKNEVSPSRHWPSCWIRWVTATPEVGHGDAGVGEADLGVICLNALDSLKSEPGDQKATLA
jgi:hypothetical protein